MTNKVKATIYGANFLGYAKSASLREENAGVEPTYIEWCESGGASFVHFFADGGLSDIRSVADKSINGKFTRVAWLLEPRCLHPENYEYVKGNYDNFKYILSYDKDFLKEIPNGLYYPFGGSSIAFDKWGIYPKTRNVCMFYSGKDTTEGHKLRKQIVEQFGDRIDVYGAGVGKPVDTKFEVLKDYRYCVVVESCFTSGYWSEKLLDCISVGTIPIYKGEFNHPFSTAYWIKDLDTLDKTLQIMTKERYERHKSMDWDYMSMDREEAKQYRCVEDWLWLNRSWIFL